MSKFIWLLDAGHGGVINGVPQTAGKRSPDWDKGILYEGVSNRSFVRELMILCEKAGIRAVELVPELEDISLRERVNRVNKYRNAVLVSVHSDAFSKESANGWSAYTYHGQSKSDKVATVMYKHAMKAKLNLREDYSDGDPDKEANFYILRNTNCPAVLVENLFMTNKKDYATLNSKKGRATLIKIMFETIKEIERTGL